MACSSSCHKLFLLIESVSFEPAQPLLNQTVKIIIRAKYIGSSSLTSNIGVNELNRQAAIGFQAKGPAKKKAAEDYQRMKNDLISRLKDELRPELINRLDKIIVFRALDKKGIQKIIDLNLGALGERLKTQGYELKFSAKIKDLIAKKGFDPQYGARPIRRAIADLIENPLSEAILSGKIKNQDVVLVKLNKDKVVFEKKNTNDNW